MQNQENNFFAICPADGNTEWIELCEENDTQEKGQVNYLKEDGTNAHPNVYVKLKKKDYLDIVCRFCECPTVLIPFEDCDEEQRKKVFNMPKEQKIKFAERFELLEGLDDEEDEEEYL